MILPIALAGADPSALRLAPVFAIAVLGFAGSGFAYLLYYRLLSQVSATHVTAVTYLLPIWGLFWGLFAHESVGLVACLGVAITIVGLVLLNLQPRGVRTQRSLDQQAALAICSNVKAEG
jgi:drug/metabolite transporter (DMT)-like permease